MLTTKCDDIGRINISSACADELIRIGEEPDKIITDENAVVFMYSSGAWIKAQTLSTNWPDVSAYIPKEVDGTVLTPELIRDINKVAMFASKDKALHLGPHGISTRDGETIVEDYDLPDCWFNAEHLTNVCAVADEIDFTTYPSACPFEGDDIKGVIIGLKP
jgi:hypothetical protein